MKVNLIDAGLGKVRVRKFYLEVNKSISLLRNQFVIPTAVGGCVISEIHSRVDNKRVLRNDIILSTELSSGNIWMCDWSEAGSRSECWFLISCLPESKSIIIRRCGKALIHLLLVGCGWIADRKFLSSELCLSLILLNGPETPTGIPYQYHAGCKVHNVESFLMETRACLFCI